MDTGGFQQAIEAILAHLFRSVELFQELRQPWHTNLKLSD